MAAVGKGEGKCFSTESDGARVVDVEWFDFSLVGKGRDRLLDGSSAIVSAYGTSKYGMMITSR